MSLSIKQKLILVVTVAMLGFAIQGIVSFNALTKLNKTSTKVAKIQGFAQIISESQIGAFSISLRRSSLVYKNVEAFEQAIQLQARDHQQALASINQTIDSKQLKKHVTQLSNTLTKYQKERLYLR